MADKGWDDDQIEKLLRDFPKIEDRRPKEEVHRRLKKDLTPPKKPLTWLPAAVAALAFLTLGVLLATYLSGGSQLEMAGTEGAEQAVEEEAAEDEAVMESLPAEGAEETAEEEAAVTAESAPAEEAADGRTAVYPDDLDGKQLLTLGLTSNAYVVPVSVLIEESAIAGGADQVSLYREFAAEVDEEALGFDEYHPLEGEITADGETVIHQLPEGHEYGLSSAAVSVYFEALAATFPEAERIVITDESGAPASFDPVGPVEPLEGGIGDTAYFVFETASGQTYLAPDYSRAFSSAAEALAALQSPPNDLLASPVPAGLSYGVREEGDTAVVTFDAPLDLAALDQEAAGMLLESFALTAASFGKQIRLENTVQEDWNGHPLTAPLEVPLAPNKVGFTP
ncbi:hypothetical protein [Indiicoccus explosivorum]|uniref:hypothetical protein n=1 Tax=Indiicoccus explosivorum TaxID=1917864 RepID=UPI000B4545AB|nr:hypothetical protein [Indiicoccus explosivorum]